MSTSAQTIAGAKTFSTAPILSSLTASQAVFTDASKNLTSNAITGTGNVVMSAAPTLTGVVTVANILDSGLTASQAVFSDGTKNLVSNAITGSGNVVMSASPTLTGTVALAALTASANVAIAGQGYGAVGSTVTPGGTTATIDWDTGNTQVLSLASASGDVTVTLSNGHNGAVYTLYVIQGGTPRNIVVTAKWPGGLAPTISVANGAIDIISFSVTGGVYYGVYNQAFS